jgi:hypothetical protein
MKKLFLLLITFNLISKDHVAYQPSIIFNCTGTSMIVMSKDENDKTLLTAILEPRLYATHATSYKYKIVAAFFPKPKTLEFVPEKDTNYAILVENGKLVAKSASYNPVKKKN